MVEMARMRDAKLLLYLSVFEARNKCFLETMIAPAFVFFTIAPKVVSN